MSEGLPDRVNSPNAATRAPRPRGPLTARRSQPKPRIRTIRPAAASSVPSGHTSDSAPSLSELQQPSSHSQDVQAKPLETGRVSGGVSDQINVARSKDVDEAKPPPVASRCQTSGTKEADGSQRNWCRGFEPQHAESRTQALDDGSARKAAGENVSSEPPQSVCSEAERIVYGLNSMSPSSTPLLGKRKRTLPPDHSREIGAKSNETARHKSAKPSPMASGAGATHSSVKLPHLGYAALHRGLFGRVLPASRRQGAAARSEAVRLPELRPSSLRDKAFLNDCDLFVNDFLPSAAHNIGSPDSAGPEMQTPNALSTNAEQSRSPPAYNFAVVQPKRDEMPSGMNGVVQSHGSGTTVPEGWPADAYIDLTQDDSDSSELASISELVPGRHKREVSKQSPRPQQAAGQRSPQAITEQPPQAGYQQPSPAGSEKPEQAINERLPQAVCRKPEQTVEGQPPQISHEHPSQVVQEQPQQAVCQQPRLADFERLPPVFGVQPQQTVSEQLPHTIGEQPSQDVNEFLNSQASGTEGHRGISIGGNQEHNNTPGKADAGEPQTLDTHNSEDFPFEELQDFSHVEHSDSDYAPSRESSPGSSIAPPLDSEDLEVGGAPRESTPPTASDPEPEVSNAVDCPYLCKLPTATGREPKSRETLVKLVDRILDRMPGAKFFGSSDLRIRGSLGNSKSYFKRKAKEKAGSTRRKAWFGKVAERQRWAEQQDALRSVPQARPWVYPRGRDFAMSGRVQQKLTGAKRAN